MPSLNAGPFLERAICSALDQSYDNIELFVIDGSSVDGSQDIIRLYENELTWWTSEPTHGRAGAINAGLSRVIEHRRAQTATSLVESSNLRAMTSLRSSTAMTCCCRARFTTWSTV